MSSLGAALLLVRALPTEPAVALARLLVVLYLFLRPSYRREIERNLALACGRHDRFFWVRNAWAVGRNLALMAAIGTGREQAMIDRAEVYIDNTTRRILEQELHVAMASFHFGLWEMMPQVFARAGWRVGLLAGRQQDRFVARVASRARRSRGVSAVTKAKSALRLAGRPGLTGFMLDNTSRGNQEWFQDGSLRMRVPVFGFELARRRGLAVVPIWGCLERGRLRIGVGRPGPAAEVVGQLLEQARRRPEEWVLWAKAGALKAEKSEE
jgi:lauroyl/myristoyl acyltransferase